MPRFPELIHVEQLCTMGSFLLLSMLLYLPLLHPLVFLLPLFYFPLFPAISNSLGYPKITPNPALFPSFFSTPILFPNSRSSSRADSLRISRTYFLRPSLYDATATICKSSTHPYQTCQDCIDGKIQLASLNRWHIAGERMPRDVALRG